MECIQSRDRGQQKEVGSVDSHFVCIVFYILPLTDVLFMCS